MTYTLRVQDSAFMDIAKGVEYYDRQREGLSVDFELCLEEGYGDICSAPLAYQIKYSQVRIKYIRRFPYGIHYLVEGDVIYIVAVFHTSKSPKNWFERLNDKK